MKKELKVKGRKIIALGLIALMLFVPFSSNLGDKMRTMAEEGNPDDGSEPNPDSEVTVEYTVSANLRDSGSVNAEDINETNPGKNGCLRIRRSGNENIPERKIKGLSDSLKLNLKADPVFEERYNVSSGGKELECEIDSVYEEVPIYGAYQKEDGSWQGNAQIIVNAKLKQKMVFTIEYTWAEDNLTGDPKYKKYWPNELPGGDMKTIEISNGQTVHLLARPQIKNVYTEFTISDLEYVRNGEKVPADAKVSYDWDSDEYRAEYINQVTKYLNDNQQAWITEQNEKALYREMVKYTYETQDVPAPSDFIWTPSKENIDGVHKSATFPAIDPSGENENDNENDNDNILIGDIEYAVVTYAENPESGEISKGDGDAATSTDVEPPATSTDVPKSFVPPVPTDVNLWGTEEINRTAKSGYNYGFAGYVVYDEATKTRKLVKEIAHTNCSPEIDCDPPTIESVGLYKLDKTTNEWVLASNSTAIRPINTGTNKYRYVIKVTDLHGVNDSNIRAYSYKDGKIAGNVHWGYYDDVHKDTSDSMKLGYKDYYYIDLSYCSVIRGKEMYFPARMMYDEFLPEDQILHLYVVASDKLGNAYSMQEKSEQMINPPVRKSMYSAVTVLESFYYLDGVKVPEDDKLPEHTNKELKIEVHVGSSEMINRMVLYRTIINEDGLEEQKEYKVLTGKVVASETEEVGVDEFPVTTPDSDTEDDPNCYDAKYTFVLPGKDLEQEDINAILKGLKFVVTDESWEEADGEDSDHYAEVVIGDVALDGSMPIISDFKDANGNAIEFDKWYNTKELKFNVSSGKRAEEDYINSVKAYISLNGKPNSVETENVYDYTDDTKFSKNKEFSIITNTSQSPDGTSIMLEATDLAQNKGVEDFKLKIDNNAPKIVNNEIILDVNGVENKIDGGASDLGTKCLAAMPKVQFTAKDAITLDKYTVKITYPDKKTFEDEQTIEVEPAVDVTDDIDYTIPIQAGKTAYEDGKYTVEIVVYDKAGLKSNTRTISFVLDTKDPVVTLTPITESKKTTGYYSTNTMEVLCSIVDDNVNYSEFILVDEYDNKEYLVKKASDRKQDGGYVLKIDGQGKHTFTLKGQDLAGRKAEDKKMTVYLDNQKPILHTSVSSSVSAVNGDYKAPVTVSYSIEDAYKDENDVTGSITRSIAGNTLENTTNLSRLNRAGAFDAEGDYVVTVRTTDLAGNVSADSVETFRVDLNAPQIQILGASANTSNNATVSFEMTEAFYKDATAEVVIYRKPGDGVAESEYKKIQMNLADTTTRQSETLSETGTYRIVMTARDRAGHTSETNAEFTIDKSAPVITIQGATDFDKKSEPINVNVEIAEDFYVNKTVSIKGTRKIASGKVESLDFTGSFVPGANPTKFVQEFKEDGIYDLTITATDPIGNSTTKTIHFTIDQTKPVIGDLSKYDNKVMNNFTWDIDTDKLVTDLTVCDVHVYLNGIEYDGSEALEDGAYTLLVTAVDELGHESEATANFVIDTKAPVFIITGVKDGEIKNEPYNITISLQLADDILDSVLLNGQSYTIGENNTVTITVNDGGKYELTLHARDAAGNESEEVISFVFGKEKKFNSIFLIAAITGGILVIGGIIFIILAKRRKEDDRY